MAEFKYVMIDGITGPVKTAQFAGAFSCYDFGPGWGPKKTYMMIDGASIRPALLKLCYTRKIISNIVLTLGDDESSTTFVYRWRQAIIDKIIPWEKNSGDAWDEYWRSFVGFEFSYYSPTSELRSYSQPGLLVTPSVTMSASNWTKTRLQSPLRSMNTKSATFSRLRVR